ncbi:MAG: hypothetical protein ACRCYQ_11220, partial [Nocardioides sp.]
PAARWAERVLASLRSRSTSNGWVIGHVKIAAVTEAGTSKLSLVSAAWAPSTDLDDAGSVRNATARLNARVACSPEQLDEALGQAIGAADVEFGTRTEVVGGSPAFRPGYPRPIHHFGVADLADAARTA